MRSPFSFVDVLQMYLLTTNDNYTIIVAMMGDDYRPRVCIYV